MFDVIILNILHMAFTCDVELLNYHTMAESLLTVFFKKKTIKTKPDC